MRYNGIFYYISYIDLDDECVLAIQTDLIGELENLQSISFTDILADKSLKLFIWKEITE